jgi:hypothetical protein
MTRILSGALFLALPVAIVSLVSSAAHAHALLAAPMPRDQRDGYKDPNGPCGIAAATSQTRTALTPGASFMVTWKETINHPGCFVIDFSASGDSNWQVIGKKSHANPPAPTNPTTSNPRNWSTMVTIPSGPCTACTLRLRQIMNDGGSDYTDAQCPPATVASGKTYYSCANVSIAGSTGTGGTGGAGGSTGGTGGSGSGGTTGGGGGSSGSTGSAGSTGAAGTTGTAGTTGAAGSNATGAAGTGSPTGAAGTSASGTAGTTGAAGSGNTTGSAGTTGSGGSGNDDSGGCAIAGRGAGSGGLLVLLGLWLVRRPRRRRSRS